MTGLSELPFDPPEPESARTVVTVTERKCRPHLWEREVASVDLRPGGDITPGVGPWRCARCGATKDEARSRRGKSSSDQGKVAERQIARDTGGVRVGHHGGPVDVLSPAPRRFAIQSKRVVAPPPLKDALGSRRITFPEWMWDELRRLPTTGGDVPALIVSDKPGSGHGRRSLVVVDYRDYVELYGEPEEREL